MKVVICNGGYRTGSTLSFNICLEIAKLTGIGGKDFRSVGANHEAVTSLCNLDKSFLTNWWFVKSHEFMPNENLSHVKIIHTFRDPLAVAVSIKSFMPKFTEDWIIDTLLNQKKMAIYHCGRKDTLIVQYDALCNQIEDAIDSIAKHMGTTLTKNQVNTIKSKLSIENVKKLCDKIPQDGADSFTQWRHNHISEKNQLKALSPKLLARIKREVL